MNPPIAFALGFAAGTALTLLVGLWWAVAAKRQADAAVQSIMLERQVEEVPLKEAIRLAWDRDRASVEAEAAEPLALLTDEESDNLKALAEGLRAGPHEARRRLIVEETKRQGDDRNGNG